MKTLITWWRNWGTLPVYSWVKAAELFQSGKFQEAIPLFEKGLEKHPEHPAGDAARMDLAYCYYRQSKYDASEEELADIVEFNSEHEEAFLRLARVQLLQEKFEEALETLRTAMKAGHINADFVFLFFRCAFEMGRSAPLLEEALQYLNDLPEEYQYDDRVQSLQVLAPILIDECKNKNACFPICGEMRNTPLLLEM